MKKLFACLSFIIGFGLVTTVFASTTLSCNDILGLWGGDLGSLSAVNLHIQDTGGNRMEDASISFHPNPNESVGFGMLKGQCIQNPDGSVTMNLAVHYYSLNATVNTTLISPNQLKVSFRGNDISEGYAGSGTLTKFH